MSRYLVFLLGFWSSNLWCQPAGYGFVKQILIQSSQVSGTSDLTDFPMLISFTDTDLRTTSNGGNVEHVNGYDIVFTLADCSTMLDHEIEDYNPSTGEYIAWVKIPTLGASSNTNVHMYYGNSSVTTDPSTTSVWSSGFIGVWHLHENPSGTAPQMDESTSNNFDGTSGGTMTSADSIDAQIGGGLDFDGSNDRVTRADNATLDVGVNDLTLSAWINIDNTTGNKEIINKKAGGTRTNGYAIRVRDNEIQIAYKASGLANTNVISSNPISLSATTWTYAAVTFNVSGDSAVIYVNGVAEPSIAIFAGTSLANGEDFSIGRRLTANNDSGMDGRIDEVRIATVARTTDWIATEYNNQNSPSTFYTISAEFTSPTLCSTLPIELLNFSVELVNQSFIKLDWQTASEINNDYFLIERSKDGANWEGITRLEGAGNSSSLLSYSSIDENPYDGLSYYRLKQTDFDGQFSYSQIRSVNVSAQQLVNNSQIKIYPNPTTNQIIIKGNPNELENITLYNTLGQNVTLLTKQTLTNENQLIIIDISKLNTGMYYIKTKTTANK